MRISEKNKCRFWSKVKKTNSCWIWTASKFNHGYGMFWFRGKIHVASRVSWILNFGEIPNGKMVLHRCDNPLCVNPKHLFLGTNQDNIFDSIIKGRKSDCKINFKIAEKMRKEYGNQKISFQRLGKNYGLSPMETWRIIKNLRWNPMFFEDGYE